MMIFFVVLRTSRRRRASHLFCLRTSLAAHRRSSVAESSDFSIDAAATLNAATAVSFRDATGTGGDVSIDGTFTAAAGVTFESSIGSVTVDGAVTVTTGDFVADQTVSSTGVITIGSNSLTGSASVASSGVDAAVNVGANAVVSVNTLSFAAAAQLEVAADASASVTSPTVTFTGTDSGITLNTNSDLSIANEVTFGAGAVVTG